MNDRKLEIILEAKDISGATFTKFQGRIKKVTDSIFSMKGAMVAAAGAAAMGALIKSSLNAADAIGKTADAAGITTKTLQELRHAAELSGVGTANLDKSMEKFGKTVGELRAGTGSLYTYLNKSNKALLDQVKSAGSSDKAFNILMDSLGKTTNQVDKAALASAAFGRAGIRMSLMVKDGAAGLADMRQEAEDLGLVLDEKTVRAAEAANDAIGKVAGSIKTGFTRALASVGPQIAAVAGAMSDWIKNNKGMIDQNMPVIFDKIKSILPAIARGGLLIAKAWKGWGIIINTIQAGFARFVQVIVDGLRAILVPMENALNFLGMDGMAGKIHGVIGSLKDFSWAAQQEVDKNMKQLNEAILGAEGIDKIGDAVDKFFQDVEDKSEETFVKAVPEHTETMVEEVQGNLANFSHWWDETTESMGDDWAAINDEIEGKFKETVGPEGKAVKAADEGFGKIGDLAETQLTAVFQGEFTSIGGFFKDTLDSMYSMFTSWVSKIAAQQIVVPMVAAFTAGSAGTAMAAGSSALGGMPGGGLLSGAASFAGNLFGGAQLGLATMLGDSSIGLISDLGMAITSMNPLLFAGGMLLGGLGLSKVISGLFGKKKKNEPEFQVGLGIGFDESGNLTTSGVGNPEHADYRGKYIWGRGPGTEFGTAAETVDGIIAQHLQPWLDTMQAVNDALPEDMAASFRTAVGTIDYSWYAETHHPEDSLNDMLEQIDTLMTDSLGPTVELFGQLADVLTSITPAFDSLLSTMGSATSQYFGGLTGIDQQIMDAGGNNYLNQDMAWQADTYKLLFDNAVANGSSQAFALGQQYANSLVGFSSATGVNITSELEQIREQMLSVAGNPADFQASVLQTLKDFKAGVEESINSISEAITELHPEIKLNMNVDLDIEEGGGYSYQYNSSLRKTA